MLAFFLLSPIIIILTQIYKKQFRIQNISRLPYIKGTFKYDRVKQAGYRLLYGQDYHG